MCCCDKEGLLDRLCESPVVVVAVCAAVPKICANDGAWCNPPLLLAAAAAAPDSSTICETWSLPPAPETIFTSCINSVSSANVCAPSAVSVPPGVVSVSAKQREERRAKQNQFCHVVVSENRNDDQKKSGAIIIIIIIKIIAKQSFEYSRRNHPPESSSSSAYYIGGGGGQSNAMVDNRFLPGLSSP